MIFLAVAFPTPGSFSSCASLAELMSTLAAVAALFAAWAKTSIGDGESSPSISAARNEPPDSTILSLAPVLSFSLLSLRLTGRGDPPRRRKAQESYQRGEYSET